LSTAALAATTFTPRLTINEEYTDNVDLTPDHEEYDWVTSVSPGATLEFAGRTAGLAVAYDPTYVMYSRFPENDTWRHRGSVDLWANLARSTRFEAGNEFVYSEDPLADTETTTRRGRERYWINTTSAGLTQQFGPEDSIHFAYEYSIRDYEDDAVEDTQRHEPSALLTYWLIPNSWGTEIGATYRKGLNQDSDDFDYWHADLRLIKRFTRHLDGSIRYGYSDVQNEGETESYIIHEISPGIRYTIGEDTNISMEISYLVRDFETSEDENHIIGTASIDHTWAMPRSSINITGTSGYSSDAVESETRGFNIFAEVTGRAGYNFTRQMSGDIFGGYRYTKYPDFDPEREDNTYHAGTGLSYHALDWASLRLQYTHRQTISDLDIQEYTENRVLLSLIMSPATPYRISD
jgi:hypothetical protein